MQTLLTGWDFMRWVRLTLAVIIAVQAIQMHDSLAGFIAAFFLFQVATNTGCCGASGCAVPNTKNQQKNINEVAFEEIKSK